MLMSSARILAHHNERGTLEVSIRYAEILVETAIEPSISGNSESPNNALPNP